MKYSVKHLTACLSLFFSGVIIAQPCPQISTYFGMSQVDEFKGVCKDEKGNIYAIGNTYNNNLPVTTGAFQLLYKADYEPFIVKFDSCGSLIWCTYFGTQAFDSGEKIAYSGDSTIVITGYTEGADLDTTYNCFQPTNNGLDDCFLAKFDLNGQPKWITYFGGTQGDFAYALTIDKNNNIIIGGTSLSPTLYPTSQSFQPNLAGAVDAFLVKFDKRGQFKFSTFYGGTNAEDIHEVCTDIDGNIIGVGGSFSNNLNTTPLCFQPSSNGGMDVYMIKLDSVGNRIFSTYIGGSGVDDAFGVCTDLQKNIYLTGQTSSTDFYHTAVSYQPSIIAGSNDNYCLKLTQNGALIWSTIFGGSFLDLNVRCRIDANDNIYSLINSQSSDFPMVGVGNYTVYNGANDIVIAKINSSGQLLWTTYKGGSGDEISGDLILLKNKIVVCGSTSSPDFPVITGNYQMTNNGQDDGFLTTITMSININTALKSYSAINCNPVLNYYNGRYIVKMACNEIDRIVVYDILGRIVDEIQVKDNNAGLSNLNYNQIYIMNGLSNENDLIFSQKLFLQNR